MSRAISLLVGAVVGIAVLGGAATLGLIPLGIKVVRVSEKPTIPPLLACTDPKKKCEVTVTLDCPADQNICSLSVNYDPIVANTGPGNPLGNNQDPGITWVLSDVTGNYKFVDTDIQVLGDDSNEFQDCKAIAGGKRFRCKDMNSKFGVFKYVVHVTGPKSVTTLDPWVVND